MKKNILNIKGVTAISKQSQSKISGGFGYDISKCGCDCAARVTGPKYCPWIMACMDVYTCNDI